MIEHLDANNYFTYAVSMARHDRPAAAPLVPGTLSGFAVGGAGLCHHRGDGRLAEAERPSAARLPPGAAHRGPLPRLHAYASNGHAFDDVYPLSYGRILQALHHGQRSRELAVALASLPWSLYQRAHRTHHAVGHHHSFPFC